MWQVMSLGDVCTISSSKRIFAKEYKTEGSPFYRGKEIIEKHNGSTVSTELFISLERYEEIKSKYDVPKKGDILLSSVGTLGVPWLVNEDNFYFKDGNLTWLRSNEKIIPDYLYFWLTSDEAQNQIDSKCIGSTQKALTIEALKKFKITLPNVEVQKKIVSMIKPIELKIDINRRINNNLEQQALTLFKAFFIDYQPYKGTVPLSWQRVSLDEVCTKITDGAHYSPIDTPNAPYPMYSVKDMETYGFTNNDCKHITKSEFAKMKKNDCVPLPNDILVAKDGSYLKEVFICSEYKECAILSSIAIFRPNNNIIVPEILLYLLKQPSIKKDVGDNYVSGSALPRIVLKDFKKYTFILPPMVEQIKISTILHEITRKIQVNTDEIKVLSSLRDYLLPKLISGEISVSKISI